MTTTKTETTCANPKCPATFTPRRTDQRYCSKSCAKAATRHSARGSREAEHRQRSQRHYERAAWLSYDLNRMPPARRRAALLALLEAASGEDAALRNILLDPRLLGADRASRIGKLYPDTKSRDALNIAKLVYTFCTEEWGCSTRDAIMDRHTLDGPWTPAYRTFREDAEKVPPHIYNEPPEEPLPEYVKRDPATFLAQIRQLRENVTTARKQIPTDEELRERFLMRNGFPPPDPDDDYDRIDRIVREAQAAVDALPRRVSVLAQNRRTERPAAGETTARAA